MPFFWFWKPPLPSVPILEWEPFLGAVWLYLAAVTLIGAPILTLLYAWSIRRFKVRSPKDPFRKPGRAWWLSWVAALLAPGVLMGALYWIEFKKLFFVLINPAWGAVTAGVASWLLSLVIFQLLIWIPGITPRKFLYHPRWLWRLGRRGTGRRASS